MKRMIATVLCLFVSALLFAGCVAKEVSDAQKTPEAADVRKESPAAAGESGDGETVAWVNGKPIQRSLLNQIIASMPENYRQQMDTPEGRRSIADRLISIELVYDRAVGEGFLKRPEIKEKTDNAIKQVVFNAYIQETMDKVAGADEAAARGYYEQNAEQYKVEKQVKASHILFQVSQDGGNDQAQSQACEKVFEAAKKPEADFAALAGEHSDCPSKNRGGDLGFFERKRMVKPFADAAFEMKDGEVRGCVKSDFGYHIIKKTGEKPAGVKPFEEVKDQITEQLSQQGQQDAYNKIIEELKAAADIKYSEEAPDTK